MNTRLLLPILLLCAGAYAQVPTADVQLAGALLASLTELRENATVYGYAPSGEWIVLRKGTNEMVCLADDPGQTGFSASCYHKDLDAFMERGRKLKAEGKSPKEIFDIREAEAKSGALAMPKLATTLYVYFAPADGYNVQTGEVTKGNFRYVVYIPWATAASTGLPLKPEAPGMPWIMDPGTHRAHIMINPPLKN
jgi:hypothetical protein